MAAFTAPEMTRRTPRKAKILRSHTFVSSRHIRLSKPELEPGGLCLSETGHVSEVTNLRQDLNYYATF